MTEQVRLDPAVAAPLPWDIPDSAPAGLGSGDVDPRTQFSEDELSAAGRNAFPIVAAHKARRDSLGLAVGAAVAAVLGIVTFVSLNAARQDARQSITRPAEESAPATAPHDSSTGAANAEMLMQPDAGPVAMHAGATVPATSAATAPMQMQMQMPVHGTAPIVVFDGSLEGSPAATASESADDAPPMLASAHGAAGTSESPNAANASHLADPSTTVVQGSLIPAVLETAINSDVPGFVRAVVTQDVRGFDGKKVLIPRASRLIGEYKSGAGSNHRRVYLMWTRLIRPDGVSIALASPATDASGRAGVGGSVNSHFFERLGSALLTSVLGAALPFGRSGTTVVVSGGQAGASAAVQDLGQRAPTIHVRQGEPVRVFAARDLVFTATDGAGSD